MSNKKNTRIVIITGDSHRHRAFAAYLGELFEVQGIVFEEKRSPAPLQSMTALVERHIAERDEAERRYFARDYSGFLRSHTHLNVSRGESNSPRVFEWVRSLRPDYVGCVGSISIEDPLLGSYHDRMINIHLGLSPYYRGSATNFWPLVHGKPECVGATIHLAERKVDAGALLAQVRPDIQHTDSAHDIGCKAIKAGTAAMARAISAYAAGTVTGRLQEPEALRAGILCKHSEFSEEAVQALHSEFEGGMIPRYLAKKAERDARYPLVELP